MWHIALSVCEIPRSVIKNVVNFFHECIEIKDWSEFLPYSFGETYILRISSNTKSRCNIKKVYRKILVISRLAAAESVLRLKRSLNADTSPRNFWTIFLRNHLRAKKGKQSRYLWHYAFLVSQNNRLNCFNSISLALMVLPVVIRLSLSMQT